ncbi:uncharacterized protein BDZ99DRAFT_520960 [Mytilinidion resinicola]|uniref:JmjC domain-containing protein n=1 Tax=Mytilinidion resinicola TaxID=574789 RepID=A0A6A6YM43_9PEZI|nr:uncharacterized protein BDZ99DRAFT_520960 [Mytilinidion resinicola]KAF2809619.1 hypothetical protein BDZ99DRAFT_520960 [Mytilinidion resinicola]
MPARRPKASFEPIPPDFDLRTFVENADNFQYVDRISYEMISQQGIEKFEKLVLLHVIIGGKPLVIDGFDEVLDPWTFTPQWLRDNCGDKVENARNLTTKENIPLTIKHYLKNMGRLTDQYFDGPENYRDKNRQRIYLKDIDCPPVWEDKLKEHIPSFLNYLNESTGEVDGPGAVDEPIPKTTRIRKGRGIARAGDLMSSLPPEMRAENLMCYIGHEGTYTPAHREMCASLGQNIMVEASETMGEGGKPEQRGSSIWFMTESKDRQVVSEFWLSILGHDIEVENHFAQLIAWKRALFTTYVVEQRPGDLILIPPLAPHQVWNRGTRTMKVAWNRTTVETLQMALIEALPNARLVCRDEQYKNKAIVYYTLLKYSGLLKTARAQVELGGEQAEALQTSHKVRQVQKDFKRLLDLYKLILLSEMFGPDTREHPEFIPFDSNVTCAYCRGNIFNRFLTCKSCVNGLGTENEEPYDVCMECYAMGRSCACQSNLTWVEQWKCKDLLHKYEEWRAQVVEIDGGVNEKSPLPLPEERRYLGKRTLAQVCQGQLKARPWVDVKQPKPADDEDSGDEIQVNEDGIVKKMVKKKSKQWLASHKSCHVCLQRHPKWKMAMCTNCDYGFCYGALFRAHDLMPLAVMSDPNWKCPHCRRVCNTGACRRDARQHPYEPKMTLLGHDTKKVADVRSVECLVDFSVSNQNWLRDDVGSPLETSRLLNRRAEAEREKQNDPTLDEGYYDQTDSHRMNRYGIEYSPVEESYQGSQRLNAGLIDPSLGGEDGTGPSPCSQNRAAHFDHDSNFVEPSALYHEGYQPVDVMDDDGGPSLLYHPDLGGEIPRNSLSKKRGRDYEGDEQVKVVGAKPKKPKRDSSGVQPSSQPKSGATKQFQKEQEKRKLEDARKAGRFIMVVAAMKGKSRVVKLSISGDRLALFQAEQAAKQTAATTSGADGAVRESRAIIQSDILPPPQKVNKETAKKPNAFRYRVEDDADFNSRSRKRVSNGVDGPPKPKLRPCYEEITVDSEEEEDFHELTGNVNGNNHSRRVSSWLARKDQEDGDMPTELPENFKDGNVNPHRRTERRKTMPNSKAGAQIRPPGARPVRASTGQISDEDGVYEEDDTPTGPTPSASPLRLAESAAAVLEAQRKADEKKEAEENMRAKMSAAEWAMDDDDDQHSDDGSLDAYIDTIAGAKVFPPKSVSPPPSEVTVPKAVAAKSSNSILSRPGMAGRKIKIVSAASRQQQSSTPKSNTPAKRIASISTTNGNRNSSGPTEVQLSESSESDDDSGGEIPAVAPAPKAKVRRPSLGKPSLGASGFTPVNNPSLKRGRGRPPKQK